jgi:hypothetical protein
VETVVYECTICWARAASPEDVEHQVVVRHEPALRRLTFPIMEAPSAGMFGHR